MRAVNGTISAVRHTFGAVTEAFLVVAVVGALVFAFAIASGGRPAGADSVSAGSGSGGTPTLSLSMGPAGAAATIGGSLTVNGKNFTPSSGGQQVILWVGYPNDYCSPDGSPCHGFYAYPTVNDAGSFSVTYDNVLLQSGTGVVKGIQYSVQSDKWRTVDKATYTVP
jgi:hypothetical protein